MSEKQFRFEKECTENFFTEKGVFYNNERPIGANEIIALLNSLSDKNEQLQKELNDCGFILCQDDFGNYEIRYDEEVFHFLWEVAPILNEQQTEITELREAIDYLKTVIRYTIPNQMVADVFKYIGDDYE